MPKIFISYRREDSKHAVGRLHAALKPHVKDPRRDIFIDIDNIPKGVDFVEHLDGQVAQCDVMLAVIGPNWLTVTDPNTSGRRLDDPNDFVRIELASALKRGIPVVPVVLDDTRIPSADSLPDDLRALSRRNGERLDHESFEADVARLIRGLPSVAPKTKPAAASSHVAKPASGGGWIVPVVVLGLLALAGGGAWAWIANPGDWRGTGGVRSAEAQPPRDSASTANAGGGSTPSAVDPAATATPSAPAPATAAPAATTPAPNPAAEARAKTEAAARDLSLRDDAAWSMAKRTDTRGAYEAYLGDYRTGAHAAEAKSRLADFEADALRLKRLADAETERQRLAAEAASRTPAAGQTFRDCSDCPQMVSIPAGGFTMGSPSGEANRSNNEGPQHRVSVPAFAAGKYEVTVQQYLACVSAGACRQPEWRETGSKYNITTGSDDHYKKLGAALTAANNPVVGIDWNDARAYADWLSQKTGKTYRLLSEAEWEYAARAGTTTAYSFGNSISTAQANYSGAVGKTTPVGQYPANAFDLNDMHGNVWEWVEDCYEDSYSSGQPSDGRAYTKGSCSVRVVRGGSWGNIPQGLRSAYRSRGEPSYRSGNLGFRVARTGF